MTAPFAPPPSSGMRRLLRPFSRVTSSGDYVAEIDGLRFVAIGVVVLFHLFMSLGAKNPAAYGLPPGSPQALAAVIRRGYHGVELFFVISGFILALPFASHHLEGSRRMSLGQYFLRRVTRLEPPYVLSLLVFATYLVAVKGEPIAGVLPHLAASTVYLHNLVFGTESTVSIVSWSLEIEIQFYLLVPLLSLVFAIRSRTLRRSLLAGVIVASSAFSWLGLSPQEPRLYLSILRFLQFFLTGFLFADVYLVDWHRKVAKSWTWDLATLAGWGSLYGLWCASDTTAWLAQRVPGDESLPAALLFPPLALLCYMAAFRGRLSNAFFTNPVIATVGGMCYSIYLLHTLLIGAMVNLTSRLAPSGSFTVDFLLQCVIAIPLVLLPCAGYFLLVEKPCMRRDWPQRLMARLSPPPLRRPVA